MKKVAHTLSLALIAIEGALTAVPFLLSWWACSLCRSILAGWVVSGMDSADKKAALRALLGDE